MPSEVQYKGPVCRGSWALGNNCKICERCIATKPTNPRPPMTEITHEAMKALSKKATQARRAYELEPNTSTLTAFMNAENEFAWALAALYRTGQLIHAVPSDPWAGQAELLDKCQKAASEVDRQTLANIRTLTDAQPSGDEVEAVALYRHKKRGTVYEVIGEAELQCATHDPSEGDELVIYRGDDGKLWARMRDEFHDGRFEPITALDAHRGKQ